MNLNIDENELDISEETDCPLFEDINCNEFQQPKIKNVSKKTNSRFRTTSKLR